jgi:hypothetical protein
MKNKTFIIFLLSFLLNSCKEMNDIDAEQDAKKIVFKTLLAPSTAEYSEERIIDMKNDLYLVQLTVDSQNIYGAKIRQYYLVVLLNKHDNYL